MPWLARACVDPGLLAWLNPSAGFFFFLVACPILLAWCTILQVYDFPTLLAYTNYSQCVAQQPGRLVSQAFEIWKVSRWVSISADLLRSGLRGAAQQGTCMSDASRVFSVPVNGSTGKCARMLTFSTTPAMSFCALSSPILCCPTAVSGMSYAVLAQVSCLSCGEDVTSVPACRARNIIVSTARLITLLTCLCCDYDTEPRHLPVLRKRRQRHRG